MRRPFEFNIEAANLGDNLLHCRHHYTGDMPPKLRTSLKESGIDAVFKGADDRLSHTFTITEKDWHILFQNREYFVIGSNVYPEYLTILPNHLRILVSPVFDKEEINVIIPSRSVAFVNKFGPVLLNLLGVQFTPKNLSEHIWKITFPQKFPSQALQSLEYDGTICDQRFMTNFYKALNSLFAPGSIVWSVDYQ